MLIIAEFDAETEANGEILEIPDTSREVAAVAVVATATASVVDTDVGGVDENSTEAVDNVSDTLIDAHDCGYTTKDGGEAIINK